MKSSQILVMLFLIFSCKNSTEESSEEIAKDETINQIVLISKNAPGEYYTPLNQDSLGQKIIDTTGPRMIYPGNGFSYFDSQNRVQTWIPESNAIDTLEIEVYSDYLEISTNNPFTFIKKSFLIKKGDTIVFNFEHKLPVASIKNRDFNKKELNYNKFRHKILFENKYTSHKKSTPIFMFRVKVNLMKILLFITSRQELMPKESWIF